MLCDRLGIFVDGQLVCIGNPKEITSRYGGYYVFTITVPPGSEAQAERVVLSMAPGARLTYSLGGTMKYELPTKEVTLSKVRRHVVQGLSCWRRLGGDACANPARAVHPGCRTMLESHHVARQQARQQC